MHTIMRMVDEGSVKSMTIKPTYKGTSLVPSSLVIKAWHPDKPGSFEPTIEVW